VRRWRRLLPLLAVMACSNLEEGQGGVVALEILLPTTTTIEVGEQVQLSARALDADGETVDATIDWRSRGTALTVDATGLVTAVAAGASQVQAAVGALVSEQVTFNVQARADTVIIVGDSVFIIPVAADPPVTANPTIRLETLSPPGPVASQPVIFDITEPIAGTVPVVELSNGAQSDTVSTTSEGLATVTLNLVTGQVPPDTAIVEVRATRLRGSVVPGSGQRFIILFE
jgi:hypothetical protein